MGRKEKLKAKALEHAEEDNVDGALTPSLVFSSDDDEANQDLSLKIVEKALRMRATKLATNDVVLNGAGGVVSSLHKPELVVPQNDGVCDGPSGIAASEVREEKKTKLKVIMAEEQEAEEAIETTENHEPAEGIAAAAAQMGDNMVLRKLLRGPRYFDPPNSSWGACFNCGEEGHTAVNCTAAKRKKPCYVCGGLGHNAKQCSKAQDCFICKKGGHRAKDCPEKHASASKGVKICLKCGDSGHDMFSCWNDYALDDLKEVQCYVCKRLGHLCCVNTDDATPGEFSCYKCGRLGHTGLACSRLRVETSSGATPSSCFKCGEEGHFARECTSSIKGGRRYRDSSNIKDKRSLNENAMGYRSAPHDIGKSRKKKRPAIEERGLSTPMKSKSRGGWTMEHPAEERGFTTPKKSKSRGGWTMDHPAEERDFSTPKKSKSRGGWTTDHPTEEKGYTTPKKSKSRGGWTAEHPGEFSSSMSTRSNWRSSGTPSSRSNKIHSFGNGSHAPNFKYAKAWNGHAGTSRSQGSAKGNHRFSASRFGNSSDGHVRNYNW
ncbi:zinc finger CCHC domain-containing protein 7-like isoform X2 [Abrus precatorius]|uniref:Zinc finger CCHC domain-containing protein 7-like isoform X2 n=1 Tax=Abrus precatorius TaxID=3816 RepID=A0A8B8KKE1_ABRPR|nr:zinc finger CCHC domain-containing protein 7-like isoform X2 [Abrus precatorius]